MRGTGVKRAMSHKGWCVEHATGLRTMARRFLPVDIEECQWGHLMIVSEHVSVSQNGGAAHRGRIQRECCRGLLCDARWRTQVQGEAFSRSLNPFPHDYPESGTFWFSDFPGAGYCKECGRIHSEGYPEKIPMYAETPKRGVFHPAAGSSIPNAPPV